MVETMSEKNDDVGLDGLKGGIVVERVRRGIDEGVERNGMNDP
jgi:hypothetical protein